jgi:hypothetical protein
MEWNHQGGSPFHHPAMLLLLLLLLPPAHLAAGSSSVWDMQTYCCHILVKNLTAQM